MITELDKAKQFAAIAHVAQRYSKNLPYIVHLDAVERVLLRFGITDDLLRVVAWLHDVLEDTPTTYIEIGDTFGSGVADIVAILTEPKGGNRKWRHSQTYPRIRTSCAALLVKLADRIANVEASGEKGRMYKKEYPEFRRALYEERDFMKCSCSADSGIHELCDRTNAMARMWEHLDNLIVSIQ